MHESTLCRNRHVLSKQHWYTSLSDGTFLCTGALLPEGIYCRSSILRVANDRILCARKHLCSKARTAKQYFYVSRTTVFLVHGSTFARRHLLSKQYLRVASDRILCARKHLSSKAPTVLAVLYVRLKGRHFFLAVKA